MSDPLSSEGYTWVEFYASGEGHFDDYTIGNPADPVTGTVADQHGDPVENATVLTHSITESALDENDARSLQRQAEDLRDELTNPLPESWDADYDLESHMEDASGEYVLVHEADDWGGLGTTWMLSSNIDSPQLQVDSDQQVVLSMWDPSDEDGWWDNQVDNSFPGSATDGTIVVEQWGPTGIVDTTKHETEVIAETTGGRVTGTNEHHGVRTDLPTGVYRAYPEESPERGYTFIVGSESDLIRSFESDLRDEAGQLTDRAQEIRSMLDQETIVRKTATTNETGAFSVEVPSNAVAVDVKAMKADGTILEGVEDPSLENLRKAQAGGYNGSFYLPSPEPTTVEPPAEDVDVTVYRSPQVPLGDIGSFADLMQFLEDQRLDETLEDIQDEYDQRFEDMERDSLERIYSQHATLTRTVPGAEDRYLERSTYDEIQAAEDLSTDALAEETTHMQAALAGIGQIDPPDIDNPIDIEDGELNAEIPIPGSIDPETVAPELHWSNGTVEPIAEEYYSVESDGIVPGFGGDVLVIDDYPISESDPAAFSLRLTGGGDGGWLDHRFPGQNPAFDGSLPQINAVDFSSLAPGQNERVYVGVVAEAETGYGELTKVEAWNDDGEELTTRLDTERDRGSFKTDGDGVHSVRLTFENQQGNSFVLSERVRAYEQSRSDPATVRAAEGVLGTYAVTGDRLESAQIDVSTGTLAVDVIAEDSDGPGELHLKPAAVMDGTEHRLEVNVLHGTADERVSAHVPIQIHLEGIEEESALFWRSDDGLGGDPITWGGDTRYGQADFRGDEKVVLQTLTRSDGTLEVTVIQSPGYIDRATHRLARSIGGVPFVGGFSVPSLPAASGEVAGIAGLAGIAVHRRRYA
ncbi:hypothetical protein [Halomontanus rarus]|uniref:hypothetical protein n=1 Tax=Halomontanus rarus TaxID=3034020 RepID=UPI0023E8CE62|nr:hypothetical protein [Halovivax sp. TS33]